MKQKEYLNFSKRYKKFKYDEIKPEMLNYLHKTEIKILKEIIKIFDSKNIKYVITGGTLLGAVTRKSFIPWDDDIDIAVFSEDYDFMTECLIKNLPSWILVQCKQTETGYFHEWIKVRDLNSEVYPSSDGYKNQGAWVDVYKMTLIQKRELEFIKACQHKDYLLRRFEAGKISFNEMKKRIHENNLNIKIFFERIKKFFSKDKEEIYLMSTASKPMIEKKYVFPLKKYQFEGLELTSFNNSEAYLLNHYGENWKNLPPENERFISIQGVKLIRNYNVDKLDNAIIIDKTRQDKTRQDKTRQDKTRQDKTRQDKKYSIYLYKYCSIIRRAAL